MTQSVCCRCSAHSSIKISASSTKSTLLVLLVTLDTCNNQPSCYCIFLFQICCP
uniref:Uncharacterized protein n=1 Tax=Arundo donax TaxID=35708 RepID=A0A0A9CLP7_ARUDO